jgi:hypothetical protein
VKVIIECTALLHNPMTEKLQRSAIEPNNLLLNASRSSNLPHVAPQGELSSCHQTGKKSRVATSTSICEIKRAAFVPL